jgi:hypothetical protein
MEVVILIDKTDALIKFRDHCIYVLIRCRGGESVVLDSSCFTLLACMKQLLIFD